MSMTREELQNSARKAFGGAGLAADPAASWTLISEMGWLMMGVPEPLGGLGFGREAAGVIHTELGRALTPGPAIAQMLAIEALVAADGLAGRDDLLARAMSGETMTAALALPCHRQAASSGGAAPAPGRANVLACVPDADRASHVLVVEPQRVVLAPLADAALIQRETWDRTRRLFEVTLGRDPALVVAEGDAAEALADRLSGELLFALAADSLGGASALLDLTVEYLGTRRQYDRPLALFQALKHRVADLKTRLAAAEALFWSRADGEPDLTSMGALKAHATAVYRTVAEEAVQLHGGIGLTMEHHCHLFLKRALLNCALGGDNDVWEEQAGRAALASA